MINIPVGTPKIGLLESDDQTAKGGTAMSFSGVVKAAKSRELAFGEYFVMLHAAQQVRKEPRPLKKLRREAIMLLTC